MGPPYRSHWLAVRHHSHYILLQSQQPVSPTPLNPQTCEQHQLLLL
jgi:hypothetical protein